jgi:hypothetical protein
VSLKKISAGLQKTVSVSETYLAEGKWLEEKLNMAVMYTPSNRKKRKKVKLSL